MQFLDIAAVVCKSEHRDFKRQCKSEERDFKGD
jgi:hypothetical protein